MFVLRVVICREYEEVLRKTVEQAMQIRPLPGAGPWR